jgi:NAD(P)-dependent dehydrogenase (short-subunit alcohol dehydrogenase family)
MARFDYKVVLITGGGTGIGRTTALAFAREGARIVIGDVAEAAAQETASLVEQAGGKALFVKTDVTKPNEVETLVKRAVAAFGNLHFAINNAGIEGENDKTVHDASEATFSKVLEVNVTGVFNCMKAELRYWMENKKKGVIVNTASIAGINGFPYHGAYSASKFAVVGLTKTAALEYARKGIRINAVCPGFTLTPMLTEAIKGKEELAERTFAAIPMKRLAQPEEISSAILFLCSDESSYMTGHAHIVDGGLCAF